MRQKWCTQITGLVVEKSIIVLAVLHALQGEKFPAYEKDPLYGQLIEALVCSEGVDFVFEEATGCGPSTAERIARSKLGEGRYLDIDPPKDERPECGIAKETSGPCYGLPCGVEEYFKEHEKREVLWLKRLRGKSECFDNALVVCGMLHGLSFAFRLLTSNGFGSIRLITYPESLSKPCTRPHLD